MNSLKAKCIGFWTWLTKLPWWKLVFVQYLLTIILALITVTMMTLLSVDNDAIVEYKSRKFLLIMMIPSVWLETVIFQHWVFNIFKSRWSIYSKKTPIMYVVISAVAFGLFHLVMCDGSWLFVTIRTIDAIIGGVILAVTYFIFWSKKQHPITGVFIIHLMYNITLLLFDYLS